MRSIPRTRFSTRLSGSERETAERIRSLFQNGQKRPPAALLVLADRKEPTHVYDGSLVMGNLMLAAHALGLGSCWINRTRETFELEEGKRILADLGIQGDYEGIGYCALGYVAKEPGPAAPRKADYVRYVP